MTATRKGRTPAQKDTGAPPLDYIIRISLDSCGRIEGMPAWPRAVTAACARAAGPELMYPASTARTVSSPAAFCPILGGDRGKVQ